LTFSVVLCTGASGQRHETNFAQIVDNEVGLPASAVRYLAGEPKHGLVGNTSGGSRTLYGAGRAGSAQRPLHSG